MENNDFVQKVGFSEMYEWQNVPKQRLGLFVSFSNEQPEKIVPYGDNPGAEILGVTTISSVIESDNPDHWNYAYLCNEYGDMYLKKEKLAVGEKVYNEVLELNYVRTRPWEHFIPIENKAFDPQRRYIPRIHRAEWVKVNLLGKCIVKDNGECIPGQYCQPYDGKLKEKFGMAIPVKDTYNGKKFYVLKRVSENTITILVK